MNFFSVENLSKSFGEKVLFQNMSFGIDQGQKVALVAKNGAGKTTLLKIITGTETPDEGAVAIKKDISVAFLPQVPTFEAQSSVMDYIFQSDNPIIQLIKEYEAALELQQTDTSEAAMKRLEKATVQMEEMKAWDFEVKVKQVLSHLNVAQLKQPVERLSGGQQKRVALARVLIEEPDLLIMDEPTNHLDLEMIEWLESYLIRSKLSLLLVTHDRYFLDRICNEILELDYGKMYRHKGNYSYFIEKKAEREEQEAKEIDKAKNLMRKELDWVRRMPKARGTKAKYRLDAFEELKKKANSGRKEEELQLQVKMSRLGGKIIEIQNLQKSFGDMKIVDDFNYIFKKKERIGIVGKNGVGKSTFLNILTEKEKADSGVIEKGETVVYGYYSQQGLQLDDDKRVIDVVKDIAEVIPLGNGANLTASQFLQRFQFPPKQQYAYVSTLSGGEKRRLFLLTVLMKNPNFLILDEPTNDLDLVTLSTLEDFLETFPGCLIIVSHDRYFLDKLVDHLFVFEGEGIISDFNGKYNAYREMLDAKEQAEKEAEKAKKVASVPKETPVKKKTKRSYKEQKEYEALELEIETLEQEKEDLNQKLNSGKGNHLELQEWSEKIGELIEVIDEKTMRWLELDELGG